MVTIKIYLEGGGDSKDLLSRCREGFRKYLEKLALDRMPRLIACGGRAQAFDKFCTALKNRKEGDIILLWIDSEDFITDIEQTWLHLTTRDD